MDSAQTCPDHDGMPCTLTEGHDGDHENWYAARTWTNFQGSATGADL